MLLLRLLQDSAMDIVWVIFIFTSVVVIVILCLFIEEFFREFNEYPPQILIRLLYGSSVCMHPSIVSHLCIYQKAVNLRNRILHSFEFQIREQWSVQYHIPVDVS